MSDWDTPPTPDDADDAEIFPELIADDEYDPLGVDVATQITRNVAGILPPPRGVRRRRPTRPLGEQRSGSGPDERDPKLLGSVVNDWVKGRGLRTELGLHRILASWPQLVGEVNAQHCRPGAFKDRVLQVHAESTTWATALRQMAPQIVARLNEELGDGSVVRIDVKGPAAPSWKHGIRSVRDGRGPRDTYG